MSGAVFSCGHPRYGYNRMTFKNGSAGTGDRCRSCYNGSQRERANAGRGALLSYACACVGPQNGQPLCPCMMRGVTVRDGHYVRETDLGPVRPVSIPVAFGRHGCVCPAGAEATCQGPLCPRKPIGPATSAASPIPTTQETGE